MYAVADSWSRGLVREDELLIRACEIVTKMTLLSQIKKEENEFLLPSCRGLLLHALKVPKLFESVLSILSNKMDVLVPEEEVRITLSKSLQHKKSTHKHQPTNTGTGRE